LTWSFTRQPVDTTDAQRDADTGAPISAPLTGHTDRVTSVAFSPDGYRLASAWRKSVIAATDLLNTTAMLLLAWLIRFDFPEHGTRQPGVFGALISAAATAFAVADYRPLRGAPRFPPIKTSEPTRASIQQ
jgi:hypothetical protein